MSFYSKYNEAERVVKELIKIKKSDKDYFQLIDELISPEFESVKLNVKVWIPTILARYYYDIVSFKPFKIKYYK